MSEDQESHLARILREATSLISEKYRKGQAEHGGSLYEIPVERLIDEALLEAVDQMVYLLTIQQKLTRAMVLAGDSSLEGHRATGTAGIS